MKSSGRSAWEVDELIAEMTRLARLEADVAGSERTPEPHGMSNAGADATIAECMGWRDPTEARDFCNGLETMHFDCVK